MMIGWYEFVLDCKLILSIKYVLCNSIMIRWCGIVLKIHTEHQFFLCNSVVWIFTSMITCLAKYIQVSIYQAGKGLDML